MTIQLDSSRYFLNIGYPQEGGAYFSKSLIGFLCLTHSNKFLLHSANLVLYYYSLAMARGFNPFLILFPSSQLTLFDFLFRSILLRPDDYSYRYKYNDTATIEVYQLDVEH